MPQAEKNGGAEEVTEVHTRCPFCGGEYALAGPVVRHSEPMCEHFAEMSGHDFVCAARDEARRRIVTSGGGP